MKRSIARKWAKALESGEYKQGKEQLRNGDNFCCLGVLCNLHAQEHPEFAAKQKKKKAYDGEEGLTPTVVCEWSEINYNPSVGGVGNLARLNDEGASFLEIAKIIRKHWKEL